MTNNSQKIYKIRFYDCFDKKDVENYKSILKKCDAGVQDFKIDFNEKTIEYSFTLEISFAKFNEKLFAQYGLEPGVDYFMKK